MKEQLEVLAKEMIEEVKSLKDLTKAELPEIVKEYINYNVLKSKIWLGIGLIILLIGTTCTISGINEMIEFKKVHDYEPFNGFAFCGVVLIVLGFIISAINIDSLLNFKLQPRRNAIKAITELFN